MIRIYKPTIEDFVTEALAGADGRPAVYLQTHVEMESDERRQADGSYWVAPVNVVSIVASAWNREGRVIVWQVVKARVYYRCDGSRDALNIEGQFQRAVAAAHSTEERIRRELVERFEVRRGVVSDTPVYGEQPAWLEAAC